MVFRARTRRGGADKLALAPVGEALTGAGSATCSILLDPAANSLQPVPHESVGNFGYAGFRQPAGWAPHQREHGLGIPLARPPTLPCSDNVVLRPRSVQLESPCGRALFTTEVVRPEPPVVARRLEGYVASVFNRVEMNSSFCQRRLQRCAGGRPNRCVRCREAFGSHSATTRGRLVSGHWRSDLKPRPLVTACRSSRPAVV